jgi:hypothetical protein
MAKSSDYFQMQHEDRLPERKVCANCKHIYRPFGGEPFQANISSYVWCHILNKNVELINSNSCNNFELFIG